MEDKIMILSSLEVRGLYENYDYNVRFNSDVTLLYGTNGCGKTTILNMITAIITGNLYKLFTYCFQAIDLKYYNEEAVDLTYQISIIKEDEELNVCFKDKSIKVLKLQIPEDRPRRVEMESLYFEEYPILNEIRKEFNYVYLALNRAISLSDIDDYYYMRKRPARYMLEDETELMEPERTDPEISYIENLIARRYMMVTSQTNRINNEFRNSILKSALDVNIQTDFEKILTDNYQMKQKKEDIIKTRDSYVKILNDLNLLTDDEKKQYNIFFENYLRRIKLNGRRSIDAGDLFSSFIEYNEMKKIQGIVNIAADTEKKKATIMYPIELFLDTVNEFISTSDYSKKINIDINGRVFFRADDNKQKLSIQYLSSGERQVLIFFANLIFGVKDTSSGIFVVDEPELSLHLSWQKVFVKKALEINQNVQFIFATHSPEIIGSFRNKTEKLKKIDMKK